MKYPRDKSQIQVLAQTVNTGLKNNTGKFPAPPFRPADIETGLTEYAAKQAEITASKALTKQLYEDAEDIFESKIDDPTRQNIRYAESIANGDQATLALIGWGNPSARTALQLPTQPRAFEIIGQGDAWLQVDWKEPIGGGKVASYIIRRSEDGGDFVDAKTETASESILLNQPTGKKLVYQVVAINKAGESLASNTIGLVL